MIAAPAEGVHLVIGGGAALRRAGQREEACAVIVVGREAAMLAPDVDGTVVGEGGLPSHPPADLLDDPPVGHRLAGRSEEHTSELQSLMRISYAVFCLKKKKGLQCTEYNDIRVKSHIV